MLHIKTEYKLIRKTTFSSAWMIVTIVKTEIKVQGTRIFIVSLTTIRIHEKMHQS